MSEGSAPRSRASSPGSGGEGADWVTALRDGPECELAVKGSSFLAQVFSVTGEHEGEERLAAVRARYHDATHHCWALRLLYSGPRPGFSSGAPASVPTHGGLDPLERWSDDGEPSGTAGVPILGALRRVGAYHAVVVVSRYFGGVKLGTGGLTRAYGEAAGRAVAAAETYRVWLLETVRLACGFDQLGAVETALVRTGDAVHAVRREFSPEPLFEIEIVRSRAETLRTALIEATAGKARILGTAGPAGEGRP
jgi:putative IMPACT (imprinted ancient) family translation regulator